MAKPNIPISAIGNAAFVSRVARAFPMLWRELRLLRYPTLLSIIVASVAVLVWQVGNWTGIEHIQALGLWASVLAGLVFAALLGIMLGALALDALNLCFGWKLGKLSRGKTGIR